ncbi:ferritin family protein [Thermodesulfobacteriota bacterium]
MKLKGTKTERNLWKAFAGESQARNRYLFSAEIAKEAGLYDIADIFSELAANEGEHARKEFEFLGGLGDVRESIEKAIQGEHLENKKIYPAFARDAKKEGFTEIADYFERMSEVEGTHEQRLRDLLQSMDEGTEFKGRTVLYSAVSMAQVMLPDQANPSGYVHGGELMKIVDNAAGVVAARHCQEDIVLARVADIQFLNPVEVGNLISINARLTFISRSSMEVGIDLDVESLDTGARSRALTAHLVMVAIDEEGVPAEVPPLLISTEEQQRNFDEGKARYEAYKKSKKKKKRR